MRFLPRTWLWRIVVSIVLLLIVGAVGGGLHLRDLILTGGLNKPEWPEQDGLAAVGQSVMVVGTTGGPAQEIGLDILRQGGNAMDAALATAIGQVTLAAGAWVSFAGIANVLYFDAATGTVHNLNGAFNTVTAESDYQGVPGLSLTALVDLDPEKDGHYDGRTIPVPGFMRGIEAAHKRFGVLPFADIFAPSIRLAESGFEVNAGLAEQFAFRRKILSKFPETKKHFVKEDGSFYVAGDRFEQPYLAETLKRVAAEGADYMYRGAWAQKAVQAIQSIGGRMTMADLASYRARWHAPLRTTHNGYDVYSSGLPAYGGLNLLEALNLIEAAGLKKKPHYSQSAESLFWLSHITRAAGASRDFGGDATAVGEQGLLARLHKEHARKLWQSMLENGGYERKLTTVAAHHSDGVVVIDEAGNMAAVLHTINTISFGESGLVIDGVSLPDALTNQLDVARVTEPGARLPDPGAPTIVLKDGKPFGAFSTIGAGLHPRLVSVLHSVLDFGMTPGEAMDQPALGLSINFDGILGRLWGSYQTISAGAIDPEVAGTIDDMGLTLVYNPSYAGYVVGAIIDPKTGERHGATIKHFGGRPVGY